MKTTTLLASFAAALALAGCTPSSTPQEDVSYVGGGWSCLFGCTTKAALMVGASDTIGVTPNAFNKDAVVPAGLTFTTDDPNVIAVDASRVMADCSQGPKACIYDVPIRGVAPGTTNFVVHATDGSVFDTIPLAAAAPASLAFHCSPFAADTQNPATPTLALNATCTFHVDAIDASGAMLEAANGFTITSSSQSVAEICGPGFLGFEEACSAPTSGPIVNSDGALTPVGHGTTTVTVTAGTVSTTVEITVP